jgi:hypothetical protein
MWSKRNGIRASASYPAIRRRGRRPDGHADLRYFRATDGSSIDLFAGLRTPIVERFEPADELVNSYGFAGR